MENELEELKEELAAKTALIEEMKTAADAQHAEAEKLAALAEEAAQTGKAAAEALEAKTTELEQLKADFAAQLAGKDADIAERERQYAAMRAEFDTWRAEQEARNANLRAELEAANAEETARFKARIAELEAAAKTAEQIAAEKYGAALPAGNGSGAAIDIDTLRAQYESVKANPVARVKFIRSLPEAHYNALFK